MSNRKHTGGRRFVMERAYIMVDHGKTLGWLPVATNRFMKRPILPARAEMRPFKKTDHLHTIGEKDIRKQLRELGKGETAEHGYLRAELRQYCTPKLLR